MVRRPILYVTTDPGIPVFGRKGSSTHVREMARALAALGERVVVAAAGSFDGAPDSADGPFECLRLPAPGGRAARWLGFDLRLRFGTALARRALADWARRERPWAVYERLSLYGGAGEALARQAGLPFALEVNARLTREASSRLHFPRWADRIERRLLARAPAIAAISVVMKQELIDELGVPGERIFISPMAIDAARFHPGVQPHDDAARVRGNNDATETPCPVLGYVGSFNHYHRPRWLLDLADALRRRGRRARFVVVGGSPEKIERLRGRLRNAGLADDFHFAGARPHDELPGWMAAFDLAVVPGAAPQSSPTKIVEAAAVGVPLVAPDTAPIRHLVGRLGDGSFFPPDDLDAFVARVADALDRLDERRAEARRHAAEFAREHSWRRRAEDVVEALKRQTPQTKGNAP